jgi:hypothetical protein
MKGGVVRAHALLNNIQGDQRRKCLEGLSTTNKRREVPSTRGDKRELTYRCLIIREFRIQSVVGKDPVKLKKYLEKKIALPEEDISTLILFNT